MNVFEYAMKMEEDGRAFYLANAEKTDTPALKKIWLELADDELKHYRLFRAMRDKQPAEYKEAEKTTVLATVKNVFEQLKTEDKDWSFEDSVRSLWVEARDIEKKAEEFYRSKVTEVEDGAQKTVLDRIADEEHRHWVTLDNVISFLDHPKQWLDDAEWNAIQD